MPATSEPPPGSVIASEPIVSPASVGRTNRSTRSALPCAAMCGSAMPPVNSPAISPLDAPASNIPSWQVDGVEQVAALAADLLGERDAEQPLLARRPGAARAGSCRRPPTPGGAAPPRGGRTRRPARGSRKLAHRRSSWTCTTRERTHSPSPLACGSNRVEAATPSPSRPRIDHVDRAEVGQHVDLDVEVARLGDQLADLARADQLGQPGDPGVVLLGGRRWRPRARCWRRRPCRRSGRARRCRAASAG